MLDVAMRRAAPKVGASPSQGAQINLREGVAEMSSKRDPVFPPRSRLESAVQPGILQQWRRDAHEARRVGRCRIPIFLVHLHLLSQSGCVWMERVPRVGGTR